MNRNMFLAIAVLSTLLLSGCATTSTPELFEQARLTGNWTGVNARLNAIDRAANQADKMCPRGAKPWCVKRGRIETCRCVGDSDGRDRWDSLWDR
jgi:outer membrane murein-binding lipoprotein Lpp